ncbi:hypothetical protein [Mycolicibacillus koreensis]|nr:hypothetical protein [Mycolicibacillus koreensis]
MAVDDQTHGAPARIIDGEVDGKVDGKVDGDAPGFPFLAMI